LVAASYKLRSVSQVTYTYVGDCWWWPKWEGINVRGLLPAAGWLAGCWLGVPLVWSSPTTPTQSQPQPPSFVTSLLASSSSMD
jgi:hypothetical protein